MQAKSQNVDVEQVKQNINELNDANIALLAQSTLRMIDELLPKEEQEEEEKEGEREEEQDEDDEEELSEEEQEQEEEEELSDDDEDEDENNKYYQIEQTEYVKECLKKAINKKNINIDLLQNELLNYADILKDPESTESNTDDIKEKIEDVKTKIDSILKGQKVASIQNNASSGVSILRYYILIQCAIIKNDYKAIRKVLSEYYGSNVDIGNMKKEHREIVKQTKQTFKNTLENLLNNQRSEESQKSALENQSNLKDKQDGISAYIQSVNALAEGIESLEAFLGQKACFLNKSLLEYANDTLTTHKQELQEHYFYIENLTKESNGISPESNRLNVGNLPYGDDNSEQYKSNNNHTKQLYNNLNNPEGKTR